LLLGGIGNNRHIFKPPLKVYVKSKAFKVNLVLSGIDKVLR
jgi:hypothetical protein